MSHPTVQIREAFDVDLEAIAQIQRESPESAQWKPSDYLLNNCMVAELNGKVVGFLASRRNGPSQREILNLAVDARHRREGIATALIHWQLASHAGEYFLEVRESNAAARQLYRMLGFEEVGRRQNYYENPPEGAIVMRFRS